MATRVQAFRPEIEIARNEPAAVVYPDRLGIADLGADPLQGLHDVLASVGEAGIGRRAEPGMRVGDCQDGKLLAHGQLVVDKFP